MGVFYSSLGILLSPWIAAVSMSGSSLLVALNALLLKWTRLPETAPWSVAERTSSCLTSKRGT